VARFAAVDVVDRMLTSMTVAFGAFGDWDERDGVGAVVTPAVPQRSVVNSVIYKRGADVAAAYDWLSELYADVAAWTVWVPPGDDVTGRFLESRGHKLDATPQAMALELSSYDPPDQLSVPERGTLEQLARINEAAYPWRDGSMERAVGGLRSSGDLRIYVTEDTSALGILDHDGDASVVLVATLPEARGRGLSSRLLAGALLEARERGNDISTLQATKLGEGVYARLGYESLGAMQMWEKRSA
jgi:GNAT superfamily N-acetyltransferase